jgi:hypothetical protein
MKTMQTEQASGTAPTTAQAPSLCVHRWVLGDVSHGTIRGHCRRCGASRTFPAVLELAPPPPPEEEEEEEPPTLDIPALAAAVSSIERHALI